MPLLEEAARAAGDIALRHFRAAPQVWHKPDGQGPVTEADLEVNAMLEARLRTARPGYGWMSEETPDDPARMSAGTLFVIDPIDGTRAFIDGQEAFAHALAVVRDGEVTAAVVHMPALGLTYAAAAGQGARVNGAPITASRATMLDGAQVLANRVTFDPGNWPGGVPEAARAYRPSLAYRLCLVAEGRFDAMVTLRDAWEWDIAAGTLIAREAGAIVTDAGGAMPPFNSIRRQHPGCIAAAPGLHPLLMARRAA
nr:3'(2'),5'-bisphosphate nucleotidase CysQ [Halovulum dunhuangense]